MNDLGLTLETLRPLWAGVLGEDPLSVNGPDNFFDQGGDSLTASELIDAAEELGLSISIEELFNNPTLETLSACLSRKGLHTGLVSKPQSSTSPFTSLSRGLDSPQTLDTLIHELASRCNVEPHDVEDAYPCTPLQAAMFASSLAGSDSYFHQLVYRLEPRGCPNQVRALWTRLAERHPILRTRIVRNSQWEAPLQVVLQQPCAIRTFEGDIETCVLDDGARANGEGDALFHLSIVVDPSASEATALVVSWHHAIMDAAGLRLLIQDAAALYSTPSQEPANIPKFASFIDQLSTTDIGPSDEFWKSQLQGAEPTQFPNTSGDDISRDESRAHSLCEFKFRVQLSSLSGTTPALALRAAWALLLAKRTENPDVIFAATLNGRSSQQTRQIVGPLLTAVPIRLAISFDDTVSQLLNQVREHSASILPHQHYGFQNIRQRLPADCQCIDRINSLLLIQAPDQPSAEEDLKTLGLRHIDNVGKDFAYDFTLVNECSFDADGGITVQLRYDDKFLPHNLVMSIGSQYQKIVEQLFSRPKKALNSLDYLGQQDSSIIRSWNSEYTTGQSKSCIDLFTFQELALLATRLSRSLQDQNVGPGSLVALCSEKSKWVMVSLLGILMSGASWIPIDIKHPHGRIAEIIEIAHVGVSICSPDQEARMSAHVRKVIVPERAVQEHLDITSIVEHVPIRLDSLAYILFTSGSSGLPKGVVISHGALSNAIDRQGRALGCNSTWRSLQFSNHAFDPSISESLQVLCYGGVVCVPSESQRLENLPEAVRSLRANCAQLTPSVLSTLRPDQMPSLKTVIFVGEASSRALISLWAPRVELINAYGPTEACIYCTIARPMKEDDAPSLIGRQCGSSNWIVSEENHEELLPIGMVGEIVCSGPSLADGYLNNTKATSAAFVECEWLRRFQPDSPSDQIYKTGDLGYYAPDGNIYLIGRKDYQVKLRGNRIELGEVETRLNQILKGGAASVLLPQHGPLRGQLACLISFSGITAKPGRQGGATVQLELGSTPFERLLAAYRELSAEVPSYMVPAHWGAIQEMPLNSSGKLDRRTLRAFLEAGDQDLRATLSRITETASRFYHSEDLAQSSAMGLSRLNAAQKRLIQTLLRIWATVLKVDVDTVGEASSFFQQGGDSLSSISLVSQCRDAGINISIQDILKGRTFGKLCQRAISNQGATADINTHQRSHESVRLTPRQSQFLALSAARGFEKLQTWRRVQIIMEIPVSRILKAISNLISVHYVCRLKLCMKRRRLVLRDEMDQDAVQTHLYCDLKQEDVSKIEKEALGAIDLYNGPSFSVDIYRSQNCMWLFLASHPFLLDSTSWTIILRDLDTAITDRISLPPPHHGIWELCRSDPHLEPLPLLNEASGAEKSDCCSRLNLVNQRNASVSSRKCTIGTFTVESPESVAANALFHVLKTFREMLDKSRNAQLVSIIFETARPLGFERAVGNFSTTAWTFRLQDDATFWRTLRQKIDRKSHESLWGSSDAALVEFGLVSGDVADLAINVRLLKKEETEKREWAFLKPKGNTDSPPFKLGHISLELSVSQGEIHACSVFDGKNEQANRIRNWVQEMWDMDFLMPDAGKQSVELALSGFVSGIALGSHDAAALSEVLKGDQVESVYVGSPMQSWMHSTHVMGYDDFELRYNFCISSPARRLHTFQIKAAWLKVVSRHDALRTTPLLITRSGETIYAVTSSLSNESTKLGPVLIINTGASSLRLEELPDGTVDGLLIISHALFDGYSAAKVLTELSGDLALSDPRQVVRDAESFQHVAQRLQRATNPVHESYWVDNVLNRLTPCILGEASPKAVYGRGKASGHPCTNGASGTNGVEQGLLVNASNDARITPPEHVSLPPVSLEKRSILEIGTGIAAILDVAWALVLQKHTGSNSSIFGYLVSSRNRSAQMDEAVGPVFDLLLGSIDLPELGGTGHTQHSWLDVLHGVEEKRLKGISHAAGCLPAAQKQIVSFADKSVFNTLINLQREAGTAFTLDDVTVEVTNLVDPWPVDIMVRAWEQEGSLSIRLEHRMHGSFVKQVCADLALNLEMLLSLPVETRVE